MSVEQAVHERWSTTFDLSSLVPPERVFTGAAFGDPALPYVVVERQGNAPLLRTSSGRTIEETLLRFHVWTTDLEQGKQIAREAALAFDGDRLQLRRGNCLAVRRVAEGERLEDDGAWRLSLDYSFTLENARGG